MMAVISFVQAHSVALCAVGVAVLDLAIDLCPAIKGNGILSAVLALLKKDAGQAA